MVSKNQIDFRKNAQSQSNLKTTATANAIGATNKNEAGSISAYQTVSLTAASTKNHHQASSSDIQQPKPLGASNSLVHMATTNNS